MTRAFRIGLVASWLLLSACARGEPTADGGGATPSPTGTPEDALAQGVASISLTGDLTGAFSLTLQRPSTLAPPPGPMTLTWAGPDGAQLAIDGESFTGARRTRAGFVVRITVPAVAGETRTFASIDGECTVTVDRLGASIVAGRLACTDLSSGDVTVSASGTFSASA